MQKKHDIFTVIIKIQKKDIADKELADIANERMQTSDKSIVEKINSALVKAAMNSKIAFGMGIKY